MTMQQALQSTVFLCLFGLPGYANEKKVRITRSGRQKRYNVDKIDSGRDYDPVLRVNDKTLVDIRKY